MNVGITADYKFNLTQSFTDYHLILSESYRELPSFVRVNMGDPLPPDSPYVEVFQSEVLEIYRSYLSAGSQGLSSVMDPSTELLERYLLRATEVF